MFNWFKGLFKKEIYYDSNPRIKAEGDAVITHITAYKKKFNSDLCVPVKEQIVFSATPLKEDYIYNLAIFRDFAKTFPKSEGKICREEYYCTITSKKEFIMNYDEFLSKEDNGEPTDFTFSPEV